MANLLKVVVAKVSAKASKNGNFIHTLKTEGKSVEIKDEAGNVLQTKTSGKLTYFLALPGAINMGKELQLDMDQFSVTEREIVDAEGTVTTDERGNAIKLKWLSVK